MQQTKLQLNNSRLIIEIAVQAAAEKQRMFAGGHAGVSFPGLISPIITLCGPRASFFLLTDETDEGSFKTASASRCEMKSF